MTEEKKPIELKAANIELKVEFEPPRYTAADWAVLEEAEKLAADFERISKELEDD